MLKQIEYTKLYVLTTTETWSGYARNLGHELQHSNREYDEHKLNLSIKHLRVCFSGPEFVFVVKHSVSYLRIFSAGEKRSPRASRHVHTYLRAVPEDRSTYVCLEKIEEGRDRKKNSMRTNKTIFLLSSSHSLPLISWTFSKIHWAKKMERCDSCSVCTL